MIRGLLIICALACSAAGRAQTGGIPEPLLQNSDAVIRLSSTDYTYISPVSATGKFIEQTTILSKTGDGKANFVCYVDPTQSLKSFSGEICNAQGKVIRKFKRSELKYTEFSSNMADDGAGYYLEVYSAAYPYTVTFEYEISYKDGILVFPSFRPITSSGTSLEKASYTIRVPQGMEFGYKCLNIGEPRVQTADKIQTYTWTLEGIPALKSEVATSPLLDRVPFVMAAPYDFQYENTSGSLRDWSSYGAWMCRLLEGRATLPEALKAEVHRRTDHLASPREKVKALYDYLGESTHYISIQLGIGGQQPMTAEEVFKTKFGDCKGLSNYLHAMLAECGIDSQYAIIHTKRERMHRDFASPQQANHAILRVPLTDEILWLECTNTDVPFGFVHENIAGHDAILFRDGTAEFVTLPQYADTLNRTIQRVEVTLAEDGSAKGHITEIYEVGSYESLMNFPKYDEKKRTDILLSDLKIPLVTVSGITCKENKSSLPSIEIGYDLTAAKYFNVTGSRCFVPQSPFSGWSQNKNKERQNDIHYAQGYLNIVCVTLRLPESMQVEALPRPCEVQTPFGSYSLSVRVEKGVITIEQRSRINAGTYSREMFEQYRQFVNGRATAFNGSMVLKKG